MPDDGAVRPSVVLVLGLGLLLWHLPVRDLYVARGDVAMGVDVVTLL